MGCRTINTEEVVSRGRVCGNHAERTSCLRFQSERMPITETEYSKRGSALGGSGIGSHRQIMIMTINGWDRGDAQEAGADFHDLTSEDLCTEGSRGICRTLP